MVKGRQWHVVRGNEWEDAVDIPCEIIPMQVYGMVNGKAAFELAMKLIEESED